jgi:hypothetical protein
VVSLRPAVSTTDQCVVTKTWRWAGSPAGGDVVCSEVLTRLQPNAAGQKRKKTAGE